ncbi:MAG: glycosyl hydrolase family 18 protein [Candidatus Manganitrophaceae bacterium]
MIRKAALLLILLFILSCTAAASGPIRFGAWVTYWDYPQGIDSVRRLSPSLEDVYFFVVHLDPEGKPVFVNPLIDYGAESDEIKRRRGVPWMTVVNDVKPPGGTVALKDPQVSHHLLSDPDRQRRHREEIVALAMKHRFAGVDIDYENLRAADRDLFTVFIRELAADLKREGMLLSVTVQQKVRESRSNGPGAADWAELCRSADRMQIMLYNLHSGKSGPGPMATPAWIKEILRFAETKCPRERVVPILKVSGMDWGPSGAEGIQYDRAVALARMYEAEIDRDPNGKTPYFSYTKEGERHTVFYEDAVSLLEKVSTLHALGYERIIFWSLGRQDPELFSRLTAQTEKKE